MKYLILVSGLILSSHAALSCTAEEAQALVSQKISEAALYSGAASYIATKPFQFTDEPFYTVDYSFDGVDAQAVIGRLVVVVARNGECKTIAPTPEKVMRTSVR